MSEFRIEKRQAKATIVLSTGGSVTGNFYLAGATGYTGSMERIGDLLNSQDQFFPFNVDSKDGEEQSVALYSRNHVVSVQLPPSESETEADMTIGLTPRKPVTIMLSTGQRVSGALRVAMPTGQDRLSDYANSDKMFRYLESPKGLKIINFAHVVEIVRISDYEYLTMAEQEVDEMEGDAGSDD